MNCEQFEQIGLDGGRSASTGAAERSAAREHANSCSQCAALLESWQIAKAELSSLSELNRTAETPPRVEMRLRQEFRIRHSAMPAKRAAAIVAWALAAAAVLIAGLNWQNWAKSQHHEIAKQVMNVPSGFANSSASGTQVPGGTDSSQRVLSAAALSAEASAGKFTLLPDAFPGSIANADVVRVRMQRGALGALGLPVNEERAGEWIQVDLLVGDDGLPQAVKLAE